MASQQTISGHRGGHLSTPSNWTQDEAKATHSMHRTRGTAQDNTQRETRTQRLGNSSANQRRDG
eukprot:13734106-Alexandrium_andersonii.AAC.1